jgi:hypothetical protein
VKAFPRRVHSDPFRTQKTGLCVFSIREKRAADTQNPGLAAMTHGSGLCAVTVASFMP